MKEKMLERDWLGNESGELICDIFEIFQEIQAMNQAVQAELLDDISDIKNTRCR